MVDFPPPLDRLPLNVLGPVPRINYFRRAGVTTIGELARALQDRRMMEHKGIGPTTIDIARQALDRFDVERVQEFLRRVKALTSPVDALEAAWPFLSEDTQRLLTLHFGLEDGRFLSFKEIAPLFPDLSPHQFRALRKRMWDEMEGWYPQMALRASADHVASVLADAGGVMDWRALLARVPGEDGRFRLLGAFWVLLLTSRRPLDEFLFDWPWRRFFHRAGVEENGVVIAALVDDHYYAVQAMQGVARRILQSRKPVLLSDLVEAVMSMSDLDNRRLVEAAIRADPLVEVGPDGVCRLLRLSKEERAKFAPPWD